MQRCSKCGQTFDTESCPYCGNPAQVSTDVGWEKDKSLTKYAFFLIAGLCGVSLANGLYPLLDDDTLTIVTITLFLGSGGIYFWLSLACKPMPWHLLFVKRMNAFVAVVLVLSSALIILNGTLDKYPLLQARTRVVRTYSRLRDRSFYVAVSPSWRQGRNQEEFEVHGDFYDGLESGDVIQVEFHRGALYLPWGLTVTDRMRCPSGVYGPSLC